MTDIEKFVKLYGDFGVECKVTKSSSGQQVIVFLQGKDDYYKGGTQSDKFTGYSRHCYSSVYFTEDGEFIEQSFWD